MKKKPSEIFEGKNSSLYKTFGEAIRHKNIYKLEVTYQPQNDCWGVLLKEGNIVENKVDNKLIVAMADMANYIQKLQILEN